MQNPNTTSISKEDLPRPHFTGEVSMSLILENQGYFPVTSIKVLFERATQWMNLSDQKSRLHNQREVKLRKGATVQDD